MSGWWKPTAPPPPFSWENEVRALYVRSMDMEVAEFELLMEVALRGGRPRHPDLPLFRGLPPRVLRASPMVGDVWELHLPA